ncbi:MAG: hypothetical protein AB1505_09040 [Candidatus Latescibacterota bacterium]
MSTRSVRRTAPQNGAIEAVVNLSVFETFYGERRPFFLEGRSSFQTPGRA